MEEKKAKSAKKGFFSRLKTAIFKLEDYGSFLGESPTTAFKYFFLLILFVSFIVVAVSTYDFAKMTNKIYSYLNNELPDFSYENNTLNFSNYVEAYDHDYDFKLIINTDESAENNLEEYKTKAYDAEQSVILLKDKLIYIADQNESEFVYSTLAKEFQLTEFNKEKLTETLNTTDLTSISAVYFITALVSVYVTNVLTILSDLCLVAIFGWFIARFCGVNMPMINMMEISIYGLTLSIILSGVYSILIILAGFTIAYFNLIYLLISYVYIIAAILMIKYDLMKQKEELKKIIEVQKKVKAEIEQDSISHDSKEETKELDDTSKEEQTDREEKNISDSDENEKKENTENNEPDGSEI